MGIHRYPTPSRKRDSAAQFLHIAGIRAASRCVGRPGPKVQAQAGIVIGGLGADPRGAVFSTAFAGLWLLPAALIRKAAREQTTAGAAAP
jgi:hypothetical protein